MSQEKEYVIPLTVAAVTQKADEGALIERRKPKEAAQALEMLAGGATLKEITSKTGLKLDSLARLRNRHADTLEKRRAQLAENGMEVAEMLHLLQKEKFRQLAENPAELKKVNPRDLTLPWAIANDKILQAMGDNKVVVEHRSGQPSIEDAQRMIDEARARLRKQSVEVDVTPSDAP